MKSTVMFFVVLFAVALVSEPVQAQFFKKLADKVADRVEDKVIDDAGDAAVKGVDKTEEAIGDAATNSNKKAKQGKKRTASSKVQGKSQNKTASTIPAGEEAVQSSAGQGMGKINTNYDFKPGERTLFATDFSDAVIGNFPRNLTFRGGQLSVIAFSGGRALQAVSDGAFAIVLPEKLPNRFTISFDEYNSTFANDMKVEVVDKDFKPVGTHFIQLNGYKKEGSGIGAYKRSGVSSLKPTEMINKEMTPVRVMVDGAYVKVYVGKQRIANMPSANLGRSNILLFNFKDVRSKPIFVTNIRIAAGGRSFYQALEADGRVAINDIRFATGKATILPESAETIKKVAKLLQDHPDLKLLIEGHTDNVGDFGKNMQLSKDRAAAVKTYLVEHFNIDTGRLESMGLGESRPADTNDTEEGRAKNRRVEIVKM